MEQGYWTDIVSATGWERKGSREDVLPGKFKGEREIKRERERRRKEEEEERKEAKKQGEMEGVKDWEPLPTDCYKSECITNASFTALTRSSLCSIISCDSLDCNPPRLLTPWNSPGKNTGVGGQFLFPTQRLTLHLLFCRQLLYC